MHVLDLASDKNFESWRSRDPSIRSAQSLKLLHRPLPFDQRRELCREIAPKEVSLCSCNSEHFNHQHNFVSTTEILWENSHLSPAVHNRLMLDAGCCWLLVVGIFPTSSLSAYPMICPQHPHPSSISRSFLAQLAPPPHSNPGRSYSAVHLEKWFGRLLPSQALLNPSTHQLIHGL